MRGVPRNLLSLLLALGLVAGGLAVKTNVAIAATIPVSISSVHASFYSNPNNSGRLDLSNLATPVFTQDFPVVDFNPPSAAQVSCSNNTGINENSRPFTDVVPQPDGTCTTNPAQGLGGQFGLTVEQAGLNDLFTFQAIFTANLTVGAQGQVTFNLYSDDGWMLGAGQRQGGTEQPSYVSGSMVNPLSSSPLQKLPVVGSFNVPSAPAQNQVTVSFPAAGTYPIEIDYTECCGGQLALVLGTTFGNPIPPSPSCDPTPVSGTSVSDQLLNLVADMCQITQNETGIAKDQASALAMLGTLPNVVPTAPNVWTAPVGSTLSASVVASALLATNHESGLFRAIANKVGNMLGAKVTGTGGCEGDFYSSLNNALSSDDQAILDNSKAVLAMEYALNHPTGTTLQEVMGDEIKAANDLIGKWRNLAKALFILAGACTKDVVVKATVFETGLAAEQSSLAVDENVVILAEKHIALVPAGGYNLVGDQALNGLAVTINPPDWAIPTSQYPLLVPPTDTIIPSPLNGVLNLGGITSVTPGGSLTIGGSGYLTGSPVLVTVGSLPVVVAATTADGSGNIAAGITIPTQISPGLHELEAIGRAPDGSLRVTGSSITVNAAPGQQPSRECVGTITGATFNGGLIVPAGAPCTLVRGVVNGGVIVENGAIFEADYSTLNGGVSATAPTGVALCGDRVNGLVTVQSPAIPTLIGNASSPLCAPTSVTGPLVVS
jgi:hypothetical protein